MPTDDRTLRDLVLYDRDARGARFSPVVVMARSGPDADNLARDYECVEDDTFTVLTCDWTCPLPIPGSANAVLGAGSDAAERGALRVSARGSDVDVTFCVMDPVTSNDTSVVLSLGSTYGWETGELLLPVDVEPGHILRLTVLADATDTPGYVGAVVVEQPPITDYTP